MGTTGKKALTDFFGLAFSNANLKKSTRDVSMGDTMRTLGAISTSKKSSLPINSTPISQSTVSPNFCVSSQVTLFNISVGIPDQQTSWSSQPIQSRSLPPNPPSSAAPASEVDFSGFVSGINEDGPDKRGKELEVQQSRDQRPGMVESGKAQLELPPRTDEVLVRDDDANSETTKRPKKPMKPPKTKVKPGKSANYTCTRDLRAQPAQVEQICMEDSHIALEHSR